MAYTYRYQLRKQELRRKVNLTQYSYDLQSIIETHFNENLKDSFVTTTYFEFKLYETVSDGILRGLGRRIKYNINIAEEDQNFIRMKQTFYAFVYPPEKEKSFAYIELIDSLLLDEPEQFQQRAEMFFEKSININTMERYSNTMNEIIKNFYIDVLESYVDEKNIKHILGNNRNRCCFCVKGYHKHIEKDHSLLDSNLDTTILLLEKCHDVGYLEYRESFEMNVNNSYDYLKIDKWKKVSNKVIKKIEEELEMHFSTTEQISGLDSLSVKDVKYEFKVHNVGQALATSLSLENQTPFLYIDYGVPDRANSSTKPLTINMPTNPGSSIIITHLDQDHWLRVNDEINSFYCKWYIPNQLIKPTLRHKLAEIIAKGGEVNIINKDIPFDKGHITCGGKSKMKPSRPAKHVHETGITFRINAKDGKGKELNILVAGDQQYDYVDDSQFKDLDVLVASHHGGIFCWSKKGTIPKSRDSKTALIIYSYGIGNTYGHPSKIKEYRIANWVKSHHTCIDGDKKIIIEL